MKKYLILFALTLASTLLTINLASPVAASAPLPQPTGAFEPTACMFEIPFLKFLPPERMGFECGYVTVPERHANPNGPTIRLPVAILRAQEPNRRPDPLFLAQGGPGGNAFGVFSLTMPNSPMAQDRDLVIINQRGTLHAQPELTCTEVFDARPETFMLTEEAATALLDQAYKACYQRLLEEGIDLSAYNSLENAADIDAIRQALGYDQINFYGVSYGTLLGLHLMRDFPNHLRSVILDSVVPTHVNFIPLIPQRMDRVFSEMFNTCASDSTCRVQYPDLEQRFFALIDRLNQEPTTIFLTDSDTGQTFETLLDGDSLLSIMFQLFYVPNAYATFPKIVVDMEAGDFRYLEDFLPLIVFDRTTSEGMYFSVLCAEDVDFTADDVPLEGVRPQIAKDSAQDLQDGFQGICDFWQVDPLPSFVDEPVTSAVPTLLLSGQFDPITPPQSAAAAAEYLPNSFNVVSPTSSHGVMRTNTCVDSIVQEFLDDPTTSPNTFCLAVEPLSTFVPVDALRVGLIGKINVLDLSAVIQTLVAGMFLAGVLSAFVIWPLIFIINIFRKSRSQITSSQRWVRHSGQGLVVLFGVLAIIFVLGLNIFIIQSLSGALGQVSAVPAWTAPLFIIPFILSFLAVSVVVNAVVTWLKGGWSIWGRLYYLFLTACVVGYVIMLITTGMFNVLV